MFYRITIFVVLFSLALFNVAYSQHRIKAKLVKEGTLFIVGSDTLYDQIDSNYREQFSFKSGLYGLYVYTETKTLNHIPIIDTIQRFTLKTTGQYHLREPSGTWSFYSGSLPQHYYLRECQGGFWLIKTVNYYQDSVVTDHYPIPITKDNFSYSISNEADKMNGHFLTDKYKLVKAECQDSCEIYFRTKSRNIVTCGPDELESNFIKIGSGEFDSKIAGWVGQPLKIKKF